MMSTIRDVDYPADGSTIDWRMILYGGAQHSFTRPGADLDGRPGVSYHRPSDERSWRAMLDLFGEAFGPDTDRSPAST